MAKKSEIEVNRSVDNKVQVVIPAEFKRIDGSFSPAFGDLRKVMEALDDERIPLNASVSFHVDKKNVIGYAYWTD